MLEIQLVQRSHNGVVIPVARCDRADLVEYVAREILGEMERRKPRDEVLRAFAERERGALEKVLREEGVELEVDDEEG